MPRGTSTYLDSLSFCACENECFFRCFLTLIGISYCRVIRRVVNLINENAVLDVEREAAMKQAQSASRAAEALMSDAPASGDRKDGDLEKKLKAKDEELRKALANVESMKTQSSNLTKEYDRLMEEKDKLERRLRVLDGGSSSGDKKYD